MTDGPGCGTCGSPCVKCGTRENVSLHIFDGECYCDACGTPPDDGAVLVKQHLGPEVLHSPRTATRALVILYRHAEDVDGKPGEFGEWEPFMLAGEGEEVGIDEPEKCGGPKIGVWWQQQSRAWFQREG